MNAYLYCLATDKSKGLVVGLLKSFLFILSIIYGLAVRTLIFFYKLKPYRLDCRVISVGNITWGGTGKTSLVEYIAKYLSSQARRPAVLSRGYKRKVIGKNTIGDEPYMLTKKLAGIPVLVDTDRIRCAKQAMRNYGLDSVILDDSFQQWKIKKDIEIVTIDATNPFGNRHMLPRGILREPLSSLKRVDVFVLTKINFSREAGAIKNFLNLINPQALVVESVHAPIGFCRVGLDEAILSLEALSGKTAMLFSGIADPDSFQRLINDLGIKINSHLRFPDHYNYSSADIEGIIRQWQNKNIDAVITTEKDAARIRQLEITHYQLPLFYLRIEIKITKDEQAFRNRLLRLYSV